MAGREDRERERKAEFAKKRRSETSDIGKIPACRNKELRDACATDLALWHSEVFRNSTGLKPFGPVQRDSIEISKNVIINGGRNQKIEPRGYGKTSRLSQEGLWALLYNYRNYIALFSAVAEQIVEGIKYELENNDVLFDLFPQVCYPIRKLEGKAQRAISQHSCGEATKLRYLADRIVLPTVKGFEGSGNNLVIRNISNARGLVIRQAKGTLRPDLLLLDDIQTDDQAQSATAIRKSLKKIRKSLLRLGGHSYTISVLMACTIMEPDDVPDQLAADPSWLTVRYQMLESMPTNLELWLTNYADIRQNYKEGDIESQRAAHRNATVFYRKNRTKMDAGAIATWEWAFAWNDPDAQEISAIQHAMNILIDDGEEAFWAECQNKPKRQVVPSTSVKSTRDEIKQSCIYIPRSIVPLEATRLVAFSDVHKNLLYWVTMAAGPGLRHVVEYGTWPPQSDRYFSLDLAKNTIGDRFPDLSMKEAVQAAVTELATELIGRHWRGQTPGSIFSINRQAFDCNWGPTEKNVKKAIRNHVHRGILIASHGRAVPARDRHMDEWQRKPGEEKGPAWIRKKQTTKAVEMVLWDTNDWKTNTHIALSTPNESEETLTIFEGTDSDHELFFDHVLGESDALVVSRRAVNEWKLKPGAENHYFDCLVGCMVLASLELEGKAQKPPRNKTRFKVKREI